MKSKLGRRLFAGLWFAFLSLLPVALYFILFGRTLRQEPLFFWLFLGSPILFAGACGSIFGSSILDENAVKSSGRAMAQGLLVSVLAYLLFFILTSLFVVTMEKNPFRALQGWIFIFLLGTVYIGWLVVAAGVVGGALLYFYRVMSSLQDRQH